MMTARTKRSWVTMTVVLVLALAVTPRLASAKQRSSSEREQARQILDASGVKGGLVVHIGCGGGKLTAALRANDSYMIQGLDTDARKVDQARKHIQSLGVYGKVTARGFDGAHLPYIDNMVNLVVSEDLGKAPMAEVMRILCPRGVAYIKKGKKWEKTVKPWPKEIDEWTHYLYDASNNAVSHDLVVGPPRRYQWVGGPRWSTSHEHMSSINGLVSARGKIFYIMDEGSRASSLLPSKWSLIARDAFNGIILWKRSIQPWQPRLWPLKSGPAQLPRRLVAKGDVVYATLGIGAPLSVLNAESGETMRTLENTGGTEEVIASEGVLFLLIGDAAAEQLQYRRKISHVWNAGGNAKKKYAWDDRKRAIVAIDEETGNVLWRREYPVVSLTLAADSKRVYFHNGSKIIGLDRKDGSEKWSSKPIAITSDELGTAFAPTLVLYRNVVLFSGGLETLTALAAENGEILWTSEHPESGHHSPHDVLCIDGLVWAGAIARINKQGGKFTGRDLLTGTAKSEFLPDVKISWFHHRCHRAKATDRFIIPSATGIEFVDFRSEHWLTHHWVRGACLYGIIPANGMIYVPPHPCVCFIESKLTGFNALAAGEFKFETSKLKDRLEKGPAYGQPTSLAHQSVAKAADSWPTYRHDAKRSGYTKSPVPSNLKRSWQTKLGGRLTQPVVADGKLFVASVDTHSVHALDAGSGKALWTYTAGGRVDSPPTIYKGRVLFGSADGWLYCLRASDGILIWRFLAAPEDRQLMSYGQLESVWPVHGSVLIQDDTVYCLAGRSMFLDGGMRLYRLDPKTGHQLSETILNDRDPETGKNLQVRVKGMTMPTALSDILSSDGQYVYMRSQRFDLDGTRLFVERGKSEGGVHLFAPAGFLDDTWFHRTYWLFGNTSGSGWGGWMKPGLRVPSGRIMAVGDSAAYGFGRCPAYLCQSSVIEYQLFSADLESDREDIRPKDSDYSIVDWQVNKKLPISKFSVVDYNWRLENLPFLGRAMILADKTLFVAGPPDVVDETEAFGHFIEPDIRAKLDEQVAALEGRKGALLWAISATDGKKLAEYRLESLPVFDGMAATNGRLYLATKDGKVLCFGGNQ